MSCDLPACMFKVDRSKTLSSNKKLSSDVLNNWTCMLNARGSEHMSKLFITLVCVIVDMIQL